MADSPQRGRPKADRPASSSVTVWLPVREHDRLIQIAQRKEKSVSSLIREVIARATTKQ